MFLVRSGAIEGFSQVVNRLGGNPISLMSAAGLSQAQLRNPNTYISYSKLAELLEITASDCNDPMFGFHLAGTQTSSVLGDIGVTLLQQPTIGDAFETVDKYLYLHARGVRINRQQWEDQVQLELRFDFSSPLGLNQLIQMSVGQLANFAAEMLGSPKRAVRVLLRQPAPAREMGQGHGDAVIRFDCASDGIRIPATTLGRKPHRDEEALRRHFQEYMRSLEQRYPDNLQDKVREVIGQLLPSGECTVARVAATLDLHPRVLQKCLQAEDTSYVALLQETRMTIAREHLRLGSMSITSLALNLGYADVSVFSRNFRRMTGMTATQWQRSAAQGRQNEPPPTG